MSREAASREVRRAFERMGETRQSFAKRAKIDVGTLGDFLDGTRWPQAPTRKKIEAALKWAPGRIAAIAEGDEQVQSGETSVEDAIRADPHLIPEARRHLLAQYQLLLRIAHEEPALRAVDVDADERARQEAAQAARGREVVREIKRHAVPAHKPQRKVHKDENE